MPKVVTITVNSALDHVIEVDKFLANQVISARSNAVVPAGKGVNVSRTVASLGHDTTALGFVGASSIEFFESLKSDRITTNFLKVPGTSRINVTICDLSNGSITHIRNQGFSVGGEDINLLESVIRSTVMHGDLVLLSGGLPNGAEITTYGRFIDICHENGAMVILDSSGSVLRASLESKPEVIKPNVFELEELVGRSLNSEADIIEAGKAITATGIGLVVISRGPDGVIVVEAQSGNVWKAKVSLDNDRQIKKDVGCGDALAGGLAVGLLCKCPLNEVISLGVACGTANLFTDTPGVCVPQEIEYFRKNVILEKLF